VACAESPDQCAAFGNKTSMLRLKCPLVDKQLADGESKSAAHDGARRMRQVGQENRSSYSELAEQCRWEADRTLDREVANSLRALAERYSRLSKRQATGTSHL
jgi:DNA-binding ferritin-like protein